MGRLGTHGRTRAGGRRWRRSLITGTKVAALPLALTLGLFTATGCGAASSLPGSSDGESGPIQRHADLFACGLSPDCEQTRRRLELEPFSALQCSARLIFSAKPGVLSAVESLGPGLVETEELVVMLADGTALVQSRHRECLEGCADEPPWEPSSAQQICDVTLGDEAATNCSIGADGLKCLWNPWGGLLRCHDVADRGCAEVAEIVE